MHSINTYSPSVLSTNRIFDNTRRISKQLHTSAFCVKNLVIIHSFIEALYLPWPIGLCMYRLSTLSACSTRTHTTTWLIQFLVNITIQKAGATTPLRNKLLAFPHGFWTSLTRIISEAYSRASTQEYRVVVCGDAEVSQQGRIAAECSTALMHLRPSLS